MMCRSSKLANRRGTTVVECAVVYPLAMLLLFGTVIVGLGIFRFEQVQFLAREGARYASVHGPAYASATGNSEASASTVLTYVSGLAVALHGLQCTSVSYSSTTLPCTVTVTLTYTWKPEAFLTSTTWTVTSTMPVTY
jgi:Flp pilus assembly protein TadG